MAFCRIQPIPPFQPPTAATRVRRASFMHPKETTGPGTTDTHYSSLPGVFFAFLLSCFFCDDTEVQKWKSRRLYSFFFPVGVHTGDTLLMRSLASIECRAAEHLQHEQTSCSSLWWFTERCNSCAAWHQVHLQLCCSSLFTIILLRNKQCIFAFYDRS